MKEKWTEEEVASLPAGENDRFERKSGQLLSSDDWRGSLAKAVSAFANSGGGLIIIGVKDDGHIDGVAPQRSSGKTSTRQWLEQVVPNLTTPPVARFRVHETVPSINSEIPPGWCIIVIEIDDSPHAPHQSEQDKVYYYRSASHSVPAPHFYLEALRNRSIKPDFAGSVKRLRPVMAHFHADGIFVQLMLCVEAKNIGRTMARYVALEIISKNESLLDRGVFSKHRMPGIGPQYDSVQLRPLATPLLPTLTKNLYAVWGLNLQPKSGTEASIQDSIDAILSEDIMLEYCLVCESFRSEPQALTRELLLQSLTQKAVSLVLPLPLEKGCGYAGYGVHVSNFRLGNCQSDRDHVSLDWVMENRSSSSYKDPKCYVCFFDSKGLVIATESIGIDIFATGHKRPFSSWIKAAEMAGTHEIKVCFGPDLEHLWEQGEPRITPPAF